MPRGSIPPAGFVEVEMTLNERQAKWNGSSITKDVWDYIRNNYVDGASIVEFGAGKTSTLCLSEHYHLVSFETDEKWVKTVKDNLSSRSNAKIVLAPLVDMFYDAKVLEQHLPKEIDLILLDGPKYKPNSSRTKFLEIYESGIFDLIADILVDDVHRDKDRQIAETLSIRTGKKLELIGPSNHMAAILTSE